MAITPKKAAIIVLDNIIPELINRYISEGLLPAFKKLTYGGVTALNCLSPYPATAASVWATIATGSLPGTHGITGFHLDAPDTNEAESKGECKAQYIWDAADEAGKKCIVLNYPGSWPSGMKNGIIVRGLEIGKVTDCEAVMSPGMKDATVETQWLSSAAVTFLAQNEWDLLFLHTGLPDVEKAINNNAGNVSLMLYKAQDRMLANILDAFGRDTLLITVSTPGTPAYGHTFDAYGALTRAGLTSLHKENKSQIPDTSKSKCWPQNQTYIRINLKGRDPEGIVDSGDYEKVQHQIIDALLTSVDTVTGIRPVTLALSKQDARLLGLYGEGIGDVVYALDPRFAGGRSTGILPTSISSTGSPKSWLTFNGPGIKKGAIVQRTCSLADIVPTLCYLMALPLPQQAEGAIIYQALTNPNSIVKELARMEDALYRMQHARQLSERQAWDRHWPAGKLNGLFPTDR